MKMAKEKVAAWKCEVRERREIHSDSAISVALAAPSRPSTPSVSVSDNNNNQGEKKKDKKKKKKKNDNDVDVNQDQSDEEAQDTDEDLFADEVDEDTIPQDLKDSINQIAYGGDSDSDEEDHDAIVGLPEIPPSYKDYVNVLCPYQYRENMLVLYKVNAV
jgi:hypothetical protein